MPMSLTEKINNEKSHSHAYLFIGIDDEEIGSAIDHIIEHSGALLSDVVRIIEEEVDKRSKEVKVNLVREFVHQILLSPYGPMRIGILEDCDRLNLSAANTLLKVIEEPPENTILILTAKSENVLVTIKSRCRIYKSTDNQAETEDNFSELEEILTGNLATAFRSIERIVKDGEVENFLDRYLSKAKNDMVKSTKPSTGQLVREIIKARKRISGNVNPRLVLENLIMTERDLKTKTS